MRERTQIVVDASVGLRPFNRFWRGTGFSPAELLLEPEMRQMLAYMGGLPHEGIRYLRVHYLYNLLRSANGSLPVASRYNTTPAAYKSDAGVDCPPPSSSGAM